MAWAGELPMTRIRAGPGPGLAKLWAMPRGTKTNPPGGLAFALAVQEEFHGALDDEPGLVVAAVSMRRGAGCSRRGAALEDGEVSLSGLDLDRPVAQRGPELPPFAGSEDHRFTGHRPPPCP
jgi:hypothetical protein